MSVCSYCRQEHRPITPRPYVPAVPAPEQPAPAPYLPMRCAPRPYDRQENIDYLVTALTPDHLARLRDEPHPDPWTHTQARIYVRRMMRQTLTETRLFAAQLEQQARDDRVQLPGIKVARVIDPDREPVIPFNFDEFPTDYW